MAFHCSGLGRGISRRTVHKLSRGPSRLDTDISTVLLPMVTKKRWELVSVDGLVKAGLKREDIWVTSKLWNDQ